MFGVSTGYIDKIFFSDFFVLLHTNQVLALHEKVAPFGKKSCFYSSNVNVLYFCASSFWLKAVV